MILLSVYLLEIVDKSVHGDLFFNAVGHSLDLDLLISDLIVSDDREIRDALDRGEFAAFKKDKLMGFAELDG